MLDILCQNDRFVKVEWQGIGDCWTLIENARLLLKEWQENFSGQPCNFKVFLPSSHSPPDPQQSQIDVKPSMHHPTSDEGQGVKNLKVDQDGDSIVRPPDTGLTGKELPKLEFPPKIEPGGGHELPTVALAEKTKEETMSKADEFTADESVFMAGMEEFGNDDLENAGFSRYGH